MRQAKRDAAVFLTPCDGCELERKTLFVHFCSGEIEEVNGVSGHRVAEHNIVIDLDDGEVLVLPRRDVYFISCDHISPPPME